MKQLLLLLTAFTSLISLAQSPVKTLQGNATFTYLMPCFTGSNTATLYNYGFDSHNMTYSFHVFDFDFNEVDNIVVDLSDCRTKVGNFYQTVIPYLGIYRLNDNGSFDFGYGISKNIFSNSNEFETIKPILGTGKIDVPNGGSTMSVENPVIGFNIQTASSKVVRTILFPSGYYGSSYNTLNVTTYILKGNIKCLVNVVNQNAETFTLIYDLGATNASVSNISSSPRLIHIYPTSVLRGESINISCDSADNNINQISVYSQSGQLYLSKDVNTNNISLNTESLPQGISILNVVSNGSHTDSSKIIIR